MSMSNVKGTKINQLLKSMKKWTPSVTSYLVSSGYSNDLLVKYKKSGWLESFGRGAYVRAGDKINWLGALYTLQNQLFLPVHVGGKTALQLKGFSHYLPLKQPKIYLYGNRGLILPAWFKEERLGVKIVIKRTNLFPYGFDIGFSDFSEYDYQIKISSPERAILEMLYLVPNEIGFDETQKIMENLINLQPEIVEKLLTRCNSIKVKRMFLFMAEKNNHSWLTKINYSGIKLGKGKRMIVKEGKLDKKYNITVPLFEDDAFR